MSQHLETTPSDIDRTVAEVTRALQADEVERATEIARAALDAGAVHPLLLLLRGTWLSNQSRFDDALRDLEEARRLAPAEPRIPNGIGECRLKDDQFAAAAKAFDEALQLWPEFPLAHFNRGFALETLGELRGAEESYQIAARLAPNYADPIARLGNLAAGNGDWKTARAYSNRALALEPDHVKALITLARADLAERSIDSAEQRLQAILSHAGYQPLDQAQALNLLGDIRDAQGRTEEAFECWTEANAKILSHYAPRLETKGMEAAPALVARISEYFSARPRESPMDTTPASAAPTRLLFIAGFPRAGTTLLGQILGSHPDVVTLEEKFPIVDADRDFLREPGGLERLATAIDTDLQPYRDSYWDYVRRLGYHFRDKLVVDKLPMHTFRLPVIARLFPDAHIIFAVRDPRDVVLSAFRRLFLVHSFTLELLDLESTARLYDAMMRVAELAREKLALRWLTVRNEDLVANFDEQAHRICAFADIPWRESVRNFAAHARRNAIATPSSAQVIGGLSDRSVGQWRKYREQLAPVMPILEPWVRKFGYSE
ncbi:MAG: sulfotransferase [Alphaproteobacteria bacterium]|nr:sulfotransferase [Alphaproteobacteria bacterium]